jgi:hypothetical protein
MVTHDGLLFLFFIHHLLSPLCRTSPWRSTRIYGRGLVPPSVPGHMRMCDGTRPLLDRNLQIRLSTQYIFYLPGHVQNVRTGPHLLGALKVD